MHITMVVEGIREKQAHTRFNIVKVANNEWFLIRIIRVLCSGNECYEKVIFERRICVAPLPSSVTRPRSSILGGSQERLREDIVEIKLQKHARAEHHLYHIQF